MASTLPILKVEALEASTTTTSPPHDSPLRAVVSGRFALTWHEFVVAFVFVLVYLLVSYLPLFNAITWRHIRSGDGIVAHRAVAAVDPALPLSDGFRAVSTSWLSDVLFSQIFRSAGLQGISSTLVIAMTVLLVLTFAVFHLRTGRKRLALAATALVLALHWPRLSILRPEMLGLVCFTLLLLLISQGKESDASRMRRLWLGCPALFLFWANLDGSVVLGVVVLAGLAAACFTDAYRETGSVWAAMRDRRFHQSVYLAEVAAAGSLLQPAGISLWGDLFQNTHSSAWLAVGGYSPLIVATAAGWTIVALWVLGAILLRLSEQPVLGKEIALFALASLAVIVNQQLTIWSVPVMLWVVLPHLSELLERKNWFAPKLHRPTFVDGDPVPPMAFAWTMLTVLAVWCGFALSPLSNPLLGGKLRTPQKLLSNATPLSLSQFLNNQKSIPAGLIWVPEEWGDWLALTGPAGLKISANSQIHLLSDRQKIDILLVNRAEGNWTKTLDRYGVELLVVDKQRQSRLLDAALAQGAEWSVAYEDGQALLLRRKS